MTRRTRAGMLVAALMAQVAAVAGCKEAAPPPPKEARAGPAAVSKAAPSEGAPSEDTVELTAEAVARNGILLAKVTTHPLRDFVEAPAEVRLNPDRVAHVAPLVAGQLRGVHVSIGDRVERGQRLAVLRSVALGQARAELRRARAMLVVAKANFIRQRRLRAEGISSERSLLEAKLHKAEAEAELDAAKARLLVFGLGGAGAGNSGPDMPIIAPIAGTVIERHATQGENVDTGDNLFVIADTAQVWIVAHVYEEDIPKVHVGARGYLTLEAQPGGSWEGKLSFVAPVVDESTRTLAVRIQLDNTGGSLRPGLFGRLRIAASEERPRIAVPAAAIQTLRGVKVVFVAAGPRRYRARKVTTGLRSGALVEVRSGLKVGDQVVVRGAFLFKSQLMAGELGQEE